MSRARIPASVFELGLQVRSYEVGRDGCLRPANVLRYFEHIATEDSADRGFDYAWYEENGAAWVVREMRVRLGALPGIGTRLRLATWVSSYGRVQAHREYLLWREADARLVARGQGRWAYVDRATGHPRRIPEGVSARILARGGAMRPWRPLAPTEHDEPIALTVVARGFEADSQQHINNAVYLDWLEEVAKPESRSDAYDDAGNLCWRRVQLEYLRPALPGEQIHVALRGAQAGKRGWAVTCQMRKPDESALVLRAHGLFLRVPPTAQRRM